MPESNVKVELHLWEYSGIKVNKKETSINKRQCKKCGLMQWLNGNNEWTNDSSLGGRKHNTKYCVIY